MNILFITEVLFIKNYENLVKLLVWIFLIFYALLLQVVWMQVRLGVLLFCLCT
jgi:hypothetical protein